MPVVVWSERNEPNGPALRDCSYASVLMGMVHAGFAAFPKGAYTVEEREALERSDDQPDETGASLDDVILAVRRRYGKTVSKNPASALPELLHGPAGTGWAIQGTYANLPAGHPVRRWDPAFTGGHMLFAYKRADGWFCLLDPEAPWRFAGDRVNADTLLTFAQGYPGSITFRAGEFSPPAPPAPPPAPTYTQAQYDAVVAQLEAANRAVAGAQGLAGALAAKIAKAQEDLA